MQHAIIARVHSKRIWSVEINIIHSTEPSKGPLNELGVAKIYVCSDCVLATVASIGSSMAQQGTHDTGEKGGGYDG
ncbi:hypothetical protein FOVSG1_014330 [Fusarium oxysporum f. sp. vasinfectum]